MFDNGGFIHRERLHRGVHIHVRYSTALGSSLATMGHVTCTTLNLTLGALRILEMERAEKK